LGIVLDPRGSDYPDGTTHQLRRPAARLGTRAQGRDRGHHLKRDSVPPSEGRPLQAIAGNSSARVPCPIVNAKRFGLQKVW
jgi:hypothetical protein